MSEQQKTFQQRMHDDVTINHERVNYHNRKYKSNVKANKTPGSKSDAEQIADYLKRVPVKIW